MSSPTARSKEYLEGRGYLVAVVEKWNPHARVRQDLFGIGDLLAIREGETLLVQATSRSNVSSRVKKIAESETVDAIRKAGWGIEVFGWGKNAKGRWEVRRVDCS